MFAAAVSDARRPGSRDPAASGARLRIAGTRSDSGATPAPNRSSTARTASSPPLPHLRDDPADGLADLPSAGCSAADLRRSGGRSLPSQSKRLNLIGASPGAAARPGRRPRRRAACARRGWRPAARSRRRSPRGSRGRSPRASGPWRPGRRCRRPGPTRGASSTEPLTSITPPGVRSPRSGARRSADTWSRSASRRGAARTPPGSGRLRARPAPCGRRRSARSRIS